MGMGKSKIIEALRRLFHSHFYRPSNVSTNMRNGATFRGLLKPYETNNVQHTAKTHISYWCMCVLLHVCECANGYIQKLKQKGHIVYTKKWSTENSTHIRTLCLNRIWNMARNGYWPGNISKIYSNVYVVSFGFHFIRPYRGVESRKLLTQT